MSLIIAGNLIDYVTEYDDHRFGIELDEDTRAKIKVEFHQYFKKALLDAALAKNLKVGDRVELNLITVDK